MKLIVFFSICISFTLDNISKYEWENSPFLIGRNTRQRGIFLQLVLRERKMALNSKFWPCTWEVRDRIWALGNIQHVPGDSQALWDMGPKSLLALDLIALAVDMKTDSFLLICDGRQSLQALYHSRDFSNGTVANRSHFPETREPTEGFFIINNQNIQPVWILGFYVLLLVLILTHFCISLELQFVGACTDAESQGHKGC